MSQTRRLVLGMRLPYAMTVAIKAIERYANEREDRRADPTPSIEAEVEDINRQSAERRGRDADEAVEFGCRLMWLKDLHGPRNFPLILKRLHTSERTARNKIALALFSLRYPELYQRFKTLGPTKLYRLAVLNPEQIRHLHLEDDVETTRGRVMFRQLTSLELETFLRQVVPHRARKPWTRRAGQALGHFVRAVATASEPAAPADLDLLRSRLMDAAALLGTAPAR